jgi:hypothetical protein
MQLVVAGGTSAKKAAATLAPALTHSFPIPKSPNPNVGSVECNGGHITKLAVYSNGLQGTLPAELGQLSFLTYFSFGTAYVKGSWSSNDLSGSLPSSSSLTQLTALSHFVGDNVGLVGTVPALDFASMARCELNHNVSVPGNPNLFTCPLPRGAKKYCNATCHRGAQTSSRQRTDGIRATKDLLESA